MRGTANPQINMVALANRVQPQDGELAAARRHRDSTRIRLANAFDVSRVIPIGSHARATAIRRYSDLDMLVVLRRNEAKWGGSIVSSQTLLSRVRQDLEERYATTTIRRDQQAVVLQFSQGQQSLDVVPAIFHRFDRTHPLFRIPSGDGGWIETSPEVHNRRFGAANERSGGKLRKVCQLLKWWKFSRTQTQSLQSFYVDMVMAASDICIGVKPYTHCLYQAFKLLNDRECRGLRDPAAIAGVIYAAQTDPQWGAICSAVRHSLDHSRAAMAAEAVRDFEEANRQWQIVFNGEY